MGILDIFDSPDILGAILGAGNSSATPAPNYGPPPVDAFGSTTPTPAAPNPPADWTSYPNIAGTRDPNGQVPQPSGGGMSWGGLASSIGGLLNGVSAPSPAAATPSAAAPTPAAPNLGPAPQDAFGSMPDGSTGNAAQLIAPSGGGAPAPTPRPAGPPMNIVPPPASTGALPPSGGYGPGGLGLAQILGATRPTPGQDALLAGMAGLGRGLSAVGAQRPGATGAASFAAGAGGALQGGSAAIQQQQQQQRQARMDLFNTSSIAFKDMLAAQNADDMEGYRQAQGNYLTARAAAMRLNGGTGSSAWQNSPYGKTIQVENEAQKYEKGQQILLQKRWQLNGTSPDQQQQDLDNLSKNVEAYRNRLYKSAGIDPNDGQKMSHWGESEQTPFQTKGMTLDEFNQTVPMGAWFTDQNGAVRQRTVGPPGSNSTPQSGAAPTASPAMTYDDMQALQPAA